MRMYGCRERGGSRWGRDGWRFAAGSPRDLLARRLATLARAHDLLVQGQAASSVLDAPGEWAQVGDPLQALMHLDFVGYLPDDILVKLDSASMAASLEARFPLLEYRVADFAWRLTRAIRTNGRAAWRASVGQSE